MRNADSVFLAGRGLATSLAHLEHAPSSNPRRLREPRVEQFALDVERGRPGFGGVGAGLAGILAMGSDERTYYWTDVATDRVPAPACIEAGRPFRVVYAQDGVYAKSPLRCSVWFRSVRVIYRFDGGPLQAVQMWAAPGWPAFGRARSAEIPIPADAWGTLQLHFEMEGRDGRRYRDNPDGSPFTLNIVPPGSCRLSRVPHDPA